MKYYPMVRNGEGSIKIIRMQVKIMNHILKGFCTLLSVLLLQTAGAQTDLINTGTLYVSTTADTLYISGALTNSSAASLTNNGILYVKNNISNDQAAMSAGTGTLYLNGSSAQTVTGSTTFKTYHLVTANSAGITLNNDLSVSGTHTFSAGLIHTSATPNYMVYEAGSSYTGDADARHVDGWVKKFGSTNFSFPVGNGTYERTAAIASLSASSEIDCHYNYSGTSNIYNLNPPLIAVDSNEYWTINRISGGTFKVNMNWDHSKVPFYNVLLSEVLVAEYQGGLWRSLGGSASGSVSSTGTINGSSNALTANSNYTFGFTSYPLAIGLSGFRGERAGQMNTLHWTASHETPDAVYEVQYSSNGQFFTTTGTLTARNSGHDETYTYTDPVAQSGIRYYRVKVRETGGKSQYSSVISLSDTDPFRNDLSVVNPVKDRITVYSRANTGGEMQWILLNAGGQRVAAGQAGIVPGAVNTIPLPAGISQGIYTLEMYNEKTRFVQQILIGK